MSHQIIRTKFHKILPLMRQDEVYISAPKGEKAISWDYLKPRKDMFEWFLDKISELPKFVVEDELMQLATGEKFHQSLLDMKKAGVLRLPYPAITVEFNLHKDARCIVMLRDNQSEDNVSWEPPDRKVFDPEHPVAVLAFYGTVFILEEDDDGDYLIINAGIIGLDIFEENGVATLKISADESNLFEDIELQNAALGKTYAKNAAYLWKAFCAAMLLMHTDGVTKEVIDCEKINRKRRKDGKPMIPRHTYLRIGRVYRSGASDESSEYIARKSPIPHWRRGHLKNYWHGPQKSLKKQLYINPRIVALKEEIDDEPAMKKTYHVGM